MDKNVLKKLSSRVNVIPVIAKADTLTTAQRQQLKQVFRTEIFDILQTPVYGFIEVDDEEEPQQQQQQSSYRGRILDMLQECVEEDKDEDAMAMIDYLDNMPFTTIGYEEDTQTGRPINVSPQQDHDNTPVLGRSYPWATVECCNPSHCDFETLKDILLFRHRDMLRIDTFERFYEKYRTDKLMNRSKGTPKLPSKPVMRQSAGAMLF